jgi:hypothetical protein
MSVDGDRARVKLDGFNDKFAFATMYFGRTSTPPQVGDICVAQFVGTDLREGWLTAWRAP